MSACGRELLGHQGLEDFLHLLCKDRIGLFSFCPGSKMSVFKGRDVFSSSLRLANDKS